MEKCKLEIYIRSDGHWCIDDTETGTSYFGDSLDIKEVLSILKSLDLLPPVRPPRNTVIKHINKIREARV